ncbi:hypothetical protein RDABS01_023606 [Bienertia sinuspersici]
MQFGSHFGQPAVEAFTRGGALGPVNIAYSGVYQWWYTLVYALMKILYWSSFSIILSVISLLAVGYIYNRNGNECFVVQNADPSQPSLVRTLRSKFLAWTGI